MKHRVKSVASIALVMAMLATSGFSCGGVAFAGSNDLVQMETSVEESSIVTESTSAAEITVTDDGISVSDVLDSIEIETVEAKTGATVTIQEEDISVDNSRLLSVSAFNKSDVDSKFKLYFWDGDLPEEKENWNFSDPNMDVFLVSDAEKLTGELTVNNTVQDVDLHFVEDKTGDTVKARYVLADLPAGSSLTFTVRVDAAASCDVSAVTSVDDALFEGVSLSWDIEDIVIESETEDIVIEPETNDIVIDDSIVIEGGETETEAEINSEMESESSIEIETDALDQETEQEVLDDPESVDAEMEDDIVQIENGFETETDIFDETKTDVLDENTELADGVESEISETEEESEIVDVETEGDTETVEIPEEMDEEAAIDEPETEEHFLEAVDGTEELNVSDFASMRLVVLALNPETVIDQEHVIANYDTIYLLQYGSVEQAMNAYVYYLANADAVEPDTVLETASEVLSDENIDIDVTEEQNPILALSDEGGSDVVQKADRVIALIDTGASESINVIDRVSLIDDVLEGNGHANKMVDAIVSENSDAKILSIRAMGDDGYGTVSSIVAAMEYAMNQNASIINLSLYARMNLLNSVLESEIQKAVDMGIEVVGAAGNDGANASKYMPGSVKAAYIIGACDENGVCLKNSNYGETVDYYVVAGSTSEAAAKFTGFISASGTGVIEPGNQIYDAKYVHRDDEISLEDGSTAVLPEDESEMQEDLLRVALSGCNLMVTEKYFYPPGSLCTDPYNDNFTRQFIITYKDNDNNTVSRRGYCLQGHEYCPSNGEYGGDRIEALESGSTGKLLAKGLYYLYLGDLWGKTVEYSDGSGSVNLKTVMTNAGCFTDDHYFAMTHYILSYIYSGASGPWNYNGAYTPVINSQGIALIQAIVNELKKLDFPRTEFTSTSLTGNSSFVTERVRYRTIDENVARVTLPDGVTLVNETVGRSYTGSATISGGDKFHFEGDSSKVAGKTHNLTFTTKYAVGYTAYVIHTDGQDVGFAHYSGGKSLVLSIKWPENPASRIQIKKTDGTGAWDSSLSGAKFTLYEGSTACSTITITSGSYHEFNYDCKVGHTYTIKETKTPAGKGPASDIKVTIANGAAYKKTYQYDVVNNTLPNVYVQKTSSASGEILALNSYDLKATFSITGDNNGFSGTLVTGEDGISNSIELPDESWWEYPDPIKDSKGNIVSYPDPILHKVTTTYTVRETSASQNHTLNTEVKTFTVTMPDDAGGPFCVSFENQPEFCEHELNVEKKSSKGNAIAGAIFKVEYFDAQSADPAKLVKTWYLRSDRDGKVLLDRLHLDPSRRTQSDSFFTWTDKNNVTKIVIPIGGYLQLTEVEAPAEFIVDDNPVGFLTTKTVELAKKWVNTLEPCKVRLKKYDTNGTTPLANVEFELLFVSESEEYTADAVPTYNPLLKVGESVTRKTDSNGEITFENLDQGTYRITEVKTVPGRTLLKDPIEVTLPIKLSQSEIAAQGNVDTSKGKVDSVTGKTFFYECLYEITNTPTFKVPMTGSTGTWKYGFIGIAMIAGIGVGGVVYNNRRKRRRKAKA